MSHEPPHLPRTWVSVVPIAMLLIFVGFYVVAHHVFIECTTKYLVQCEPIAAQELLALPSHPVNQTQESRVQLVNEHIRLGKQYGGRMTWMFFAAANLLFGVFVMMIFFMIAKYWLGNLYWAIALVVFSFIGGAAVSYTDGLFLAKPLFEATIQPSLAGIKNFIEVNRALNSLAYGIGLALVLVVASILFGKRGQEEITGNDGSDAESRTKSKEDLGGKGETNSKYKDSGENDACLVALSKKSEHLKIVLYASTISLVVGVLRLDQGFTWATTFITDTSVASVAEAFYESVTMTIGGFFTLLLTAVFLPVSFIIYERAKECVSSGDYAKTDVSAALEGRGFKFSLAEALPRLLAIAGPLLTGPIAELLKNLGS